MFIKLLHLWMLRKIFIYWQNLKHWKFQHIIKKLQFKDEFLYHDDKICSWWSPWTSSFKLGMTHAQGIIFNLIRPWDLKIIVWKYNTVLVWSWHILHDNMYPLIFMSHMDFPNTFHIFASCFFKVPHGS